MMYNIRITEGDYSKRRPRKARIRKYSGSDIMKENTSPRPRAQSAARRAASNAMPSKGARTGYAVKNRPSKKAKKARKVPAGIRSENLKTALWLWCPPVGLTKMWRSTCTWPRAVKIGITAFMAAILAAIFIVPTPQTAKFETGIQMVADKPEVEVYGPALPALIVTGYTRDHTGSIIVDEVENNVHYVYAADDADCYHEYECKFAFASSQRLTVYEAYHLGFKPCGRCNPPVYIPGQTDPITAQPLSNAYTAEPAIETVEDTATEEATAEAVDNPS